MGVGETANPDVHCDPGPTDPVLCQTLFLCLYGHSGTGLIYCLLVTAGREATGTHHVLPPYLFHLLPMTARWFSQTLFPRDPAECPLYPKTHLEPLALTQVSEQPFGKVESSMCHQQENSVSGTTGAQRQVYLSAESRAALAPLLNILQLVAGAILLPLSLASVLQAPDVFTYIYPAALQRVKAIKS